MKRWWWVVLGAVLALALAITLVTQIPGMTYASLLDALRAQGASVQEHGIEQDSALTLNGTDHLITINGVNVDVLVYPNNLEANLDASRIQPDGSNIATGLWLLGGMGNQGSTIDFIAPPHWFHSGRVIALYVGSDLGILTLLRSTMGVQIAGR
jgi:hypothetical protein